MPMTEHTNLAENQVREMPLPAATAGAQRGKNAHFTQDRDYLNMLRDMQQGQWARVVPMLRALQARYPQAAELDALLQDATFRLNLESNWADKVQGVQGFAWSTRSLVTVIPVIALGILLVIGAVYYSRIQRVNAFSTQQQEMLLEAQAALTAGQYGEALDLFEMVLAESPNQAEALRGQNETKRQMKLATDYQLALDHITSGDYKHALELLLALQTAAPGYRDVANQIEEVKIHLGAPQLFADAEFAFSNGLWLSAISQYEGLSQLDSEYETATVQTHLATAYFKAGQQITSLRPTDSTMPKQAKEYFNKATQMKLEDAALVTENQRLDTYMEGTRLVTQNDYEPGITYLAPIYAEQPDYFGGYVAELLYRAYLGVADRYAQNQDLPNALTTYQRAVELGIDQSGLAAKRVEEITQLLTPTPTPIPTPIPVVVVAAAAPVVEAAPVVSWQEQYRGWIAFRSNRDGGEALYIMRSDGSEVQVAPSDIVNNVTQLYQQQQRTADGIQLLYVKQLSDQTGTNIFKVRSDLSETTERDTMLTSYIGTEYDPVWSPDSQSIAFVSNHTGNDEIWVMSQDGSNPRQLTFNNWEWDKHPSFSVDSHQIVFYSNRSGVRQIWVMNTDGSNQTNISHNGADEWDPVWIH